jgi:ferredoxin
MTASYRHFVLRRRGSEGVVARAPSSPGETLFDAAARIDRPVRTRCSGSLICGQCWVIVEEGLDDLPPPSDDEAMTLERTAPDEPNARLACQLVIPEGKNSLVVATDYW